MSDLSAQLSKVWNVMKKYKYAVLLLLVGIGLLLLPSSESEEKKTVSESNANLIPSEYEKEIERRLEQTLSQIEGVGKVKVFLTLKQGEETHYLADESRRTDTKDGASSTEISEKSVIISKGSSYDEPMITRTDYPLFQGALIVCEGGGDAQIKLQLTQAISALINLSSNQITILKMK